MLTAPPAASQVSLPWRLKALVDDGKVLDISAVTGGGCTSFAGVYVIETTASVEIMSIGTTNSGPSCPADLRIALLRVSLASPLGDRALLHGPVNQEWATAF
jgi:hypothetical protein